MTRAPSRWAQDEASAAMPCSRCSIHRSPLRPAQPCPLGQHRSPVVAQSGAKLPRRAGQSGCRGTRYLLRHRRYDHGAVEAPARGARPILAADFAHAHAAAAARRNSASARRTLSRNRSGSRRPSPAAALRSRSIWSSPRSAFAIWPTTKPACANFIAS